MKAKIELVARIFLGLMLVIFGLNKFLNFMPAMEMSESAMQLMGALMASGYLLKMVAIVEIGVGILLMVGRFVPLALTLLAPLSVNMVLFHLFLDIAGIGAALVVTILNVYLAYINKEKYSAVLSVK